MTESIEYTRRCFVISPIGSPNSRIRRHADAVYEYIIKPAMDSFGIKADRSDHLKKPGSISHEMFDRLLEDDLCIAVLKDHNPNVFYELAIAQAAGKPVILLAEFGHVLPFDIQDLRCVHYDLDPIALVKEAKYAEQVRALLGTLEQENWVVKNVLPGFPARTGSGNVEFITRSAEFGPHEKWMSLLRSTNRRFDAMGISLAAWRQGENLTTILTEKARAGCAIRLALIDPENPSFPGLINERIGEERRDYTIREISDMWKFLCNLSEREPSVQVRKLRHGCPHMQLTLTDQTAVTIPYLYSSKTSASPLLTCPQSSPLYATLSFEFEALWDANPPGAAK